MCIYIYIYREREICIMYSHIYIYMCIYIYIYIERERETDTQRDVHIDAVDSQFASLCIHSHKASNTQRDRTRAVVDRGTSEASLVCIGVRLLCISVFVTLCLFRVLHFMLCSVVIVYCTCAFCC